MHDEENWLAQLRQIHETDKAQRQAPEHDATDEAQPTAEQYLRQCRAHELLRQVQKTLLDGGGSLQIYQDVGGYEQVIILMWEGPISAAAKPARIDEVEASIIVGANAQGIFVNDEPLSDISPEGLRERLLNTARKFLAQPRGTLQNGGRNE